MPSTNEITRSSTGHPVYISHAHCIAAGVAVVPVLNDTDLRLHERPNTADDPGKAILSFFELFTDI